MTEKKKPATAASESDYEVGYRKPPRQTRFKPGQSGNPRGRPKGTKNLKTDLQEELGEKIVVREGDQTRRISKQRAIVKSLAAKSLKGDARALSLMFSTMMRLLDTGEGAPEVEEPLHDDERAILEAFEAQVQRRLGQERSTPSAPNGDPEEES